MDHHIKKCSLEVEVHQNVAKLGTLLGHFFEVVDLVGLKVLTLDIQGDLAFLEDKKVLSVLQNFSWGVLKLGKIDVLLGDG